MSEESLLLSNIEYEDHRIDNEKYIIEQYGNLSESNIIAQHGQARIYKGEKKDSGMEVVIKVYSTQEKYELKKYLREIQILKLADDPNIIDYYDIKFIQQDENKAKVFIIMEMMDGDLQKLIQDYKNNKKKIGFKMVMMIFQQLVDGVQFLHKNKIYHRDLKPQNILFSKVNDENKNLIIKIADFGNVRFASKEGVSSKTSEIFISDYYCPPEISNNQFNELGISHNQIGEQWDLYATGIIFLDMLTTNLSLQGARDIHKIIEEVENDRKTIQEINLINMIKNLTKNISKDNLRPSINIIKQGLELIEKDNKLDKKKFKEFISQEELSGQYEVGVREIEERLIEVDPNMICTDEEIAELNNMIDQITADVESGGVAGLEDESFQEEFQNQLASIQETLDQLID
ncbi:Protein kinase-like domain [Pseudocohnilembus persalinus]|uniref:Protein kinase-like domain n=1 Tax=Pseudocohnilembus persalinus TaxID=266149 RepID=A0A0V0QQN8_PSEPJ|nr:Protein kinase-like domain [Pseudocohnilembus persalinus]|eukprot:KRX04328.1 Protein kinase-like domain [Pseudocohnilembus persalinus]